MSSETITKNDLAEILSKIPMATSENLPGIIKMFAGTFAPTGWLLCNGAEVAIEDYPALYDVIQDTYGTASDSDHFVLPDFRGRTPLGAGLGTASDATLRGLGTEGGSERVTLTANQSGVPAHAHTITHTHTFTRPTNNIYLKKLAASGSATWTPTPQSSSTGHYSDSVVLSGGSVGQYTGNSSNNTASGATESHGNMSPYLTVNYIISTGGVSRWADSAGLPIVRDVTLNGQSVVNNEIAQLLTGNLKHAWLANDKSTTSGTYTEVCNIELEAGVWVLNWGVRFAANSTGQRVGNITTTSGGNSYDIAVPAHAGTTQIRTSSILSPNQTTTYYLNAMQNSGSALNLVASGNGYGNFINAVRIA